MNSPEGDNLFVGSIPELYETCLVPLIFEPYAEDMAKRVAARKVNRVLEIAAGTGAVTRQLASLLPSQASIVATDLNQPMLDQAAAIGTRHPVQWQQADALQLPFPDAAFDAVACQFGVMFFPDKPKAFAEAHRVLTCGGAFIFNVWDRIEDNEFSQIVTTALASVFPDDPPRFMARTPHGYCDPATIARDLATGGFARPPAIDVVTARSRAESARSAAVAFCQGTPVRNEIEARDPARLEEATNVVVEALTRRFGKGPIESTMQALVVTIEK
jgi:SAM-dependent methyltransferase